MSVVAVLVVAVVGLGFVLYWSGRYGDRQRNKGTSLKRSVRAHTTARGQPKTGFATRDDALASARSMADRGREPLSAYRCDTCGKWHLGH